jgi:AraC-like DNA-binding protein
MKKLNDHDLLYAEEHFSCPNYLKDVKTGFKLKEYQAGSEVSRESSSANFVMFMLSGSVEINCMMFPKKVASAGHMFLITANSFFNLRFTEESTAITLTFDKWDFHCIQTPAKCLEPYSSAPYCEVNVLEINEPLKLFLELVRVYLKAGQSCYHFHKIKTDEFFLLMRSFYTKEQLARFLCPLLGNALEFRMFCFRTVGQVKDVGTMIEKSGMSRSAFYEKFRDEFGDISPKKWLANYNNQRILYLASIPDITVKSLMYQMGFESESAFTQYCKRHFGDTPSNIIRRRGSVVIDI